jgi:signal transduction histidine kinase/ligand-binding sensor domain-containing protein
VKKQGALQLLFLLVAGMVCAQPSNACFLHYTTDQGLSNDHILSITKDNIGFLWVGTVNGLNRFDGRTFKVFHSDPKDKNSLPDDNIFRLTVAPDGWLWVATSGGCCKIDPYWLNIVRITLPENEDTIKNDLVTQVAFDSKGMAWMTSDSTIYQVDPATDKVIYSYKCNDKNLGWDGMIIDEQDRLWMLKNNVYRFDPADESMKIFTGDNSALSSLSLVKDFKGQLWTGTWSYGIWKFNTAKDEFEKQLVPETLAMMLLPDSASTGRPFFWVGGGQSGLAIFYPDVKKLYPFHPDTRDPFTHNNYLASVLYRDPSSGDIWIGTEVGLEQYAPASLRFGRAMIPIDKDMGQFSLVSGVVQDNTDESGQRYFIAVWGAGLFSWNKSSGDIQRIQSKERLAGGNTFNLFQDSKGNIWGCQPGGAAMFNPRTNTWKYYPVKFEHTERNNLFWCGIEDHQGGIWFGSNREGLYHLNTETDKVEQVFFPPEKRDLNGYLNIFQISEDHSGQLWMACNASGLIRYDPVTRNATQFIYPGRNENLQCNAVAVSKSGRIYVGCFSDFLELDSEGKIIRQFDQHNGLKTNRIYLLQEDHQGKIWFNSTFLLHCYDPAETSFTYYGKSDGLFSNTITDGLSITPAGEIFVGFQNAFNFFYPDLLRRNAEPPPIAVTSIKVMNKEKAISTSASGDTFLLLRPGEDFFEVEFAALNFNQQERNRYAYQLEGFNKDWIFTDRPVATFTNLNGGTYTLHMKAANNDGVWNEKGVKLRIQVNPSFYKTTWFPILIVVILSGMAFAFLWFRRQQRKRLEKFRELLARDLHDEMGSTLSSIRFFSDYAGQQIGADKPHVTPMLQRISQSATNLSESMQDIIWAMQTDHDQLEDLTTHMMEFGFRLFEARNIKFITHITDGFSGMQLKPEVRRNVYLIFKEAVNNIAKYSEANEVQMDFSMLNGSLLMKLKDNGKGFDMESIQAEGTGNGLNNMRKRAKEIGGTLTITSSPGLGTSVEVVVPV